jgi:hypothetical protein
MVARYDPRSQCVGKVPYYTKDASRRALKREEQRLGVRLQKYKCCHCGNYHLGNKVRTTRKTN